MGEQLVLRHAFPFDRRPRLSKRELTGRSAILSSLGIHSYTGPHWPHRTWHILRILGMDSTRLTLEA